MNAKTLTTLIKSSAEHWRRMATGKQKKDEAPFARCCDLCDTFLDNDCEGCPVYNKTKEKGCLGTPYVEAVSCFVDDQRNFKNPNFILAAQKELEFLESLLPKESPKDKKTTKKKQICKS